jgi:hypothetical protein
VSGKKVETYITQNTEVHKQKQKSENYPRNKEDKTKHKQANQQNKTENISIRTGSLDDDLG